MAQKRPFDEEVVDQTSAKHQRQDGPSSEINLGNDSFCIESASRKPFHICRWIYDQPISVGESYFILCSLICIW